MVRAGEEFLDNLAGAPGRKRGRVAFGEESDRLDEALSLAATQRERQHIVGQLNKGGRKIAAQIVNGGIRVAVLN